MTSTPDGENFFENDIWRNPYSGNCLAYRKAKRDFYDDKTHEAFPVTEDGIAEFIQQSDITGSNRKSTAFYDGFSPFYEMGQKLWYSFFGGEKKARSQYLEHLKIAPGNLVLEVSVGTGANIKFLPRDACYYGLDISMGQLRQSVKNRNKYCLPLCLGWGNAEALPFRDGSFDCVFHVGGINLFSNKEKAISEMVRVAKPHTTIMICDETEKVARRYEKLPYFGKPFRNRTEKIKAPVDLLPSNVYDVGTIEIRKGTLYIVTFKKAGTN